MKTSKFLLGIKRQQPIEKISFLENVRTLLQVREKKFSNSFKSNLFPKENSTSDPIPDPIVFYAPSRQEHEVGYPKSKYHHLD